MGTWTVSARCSPKAGQAGVSPSEVNLYMSLYVVEPRMSATSNGQHAEPSTSSQLPVSNPKMDLIVAPRALSLTPLHDGVGSDEYFLGARPDAGSPVRSPALRLRAETGVQTGIPVVGLDVSARILSSDGRVSTIDLHDNGLGSE